MRKKRPPAEPSSPDICQALRPRFEYFKSRYPAMDPLAQGAILGLLGAQDRVVTRFKDRLAPHGLTPPSFGVLMMLESEPGRRMTMGDVSQRLIVTQANVTGLSDTLARKGFLSRGSDPKDRRRVWLSITGQGRNKLRAILDGHFAFCRKFMGALSPTEKKTFIKLLGKVAASAVSTAAAAALLILGPAPASAITLREAVARTLESDSSITLARNNAKLASAEKLGLESLYDPALTAGLSHTDAIIPRQSIFQPSRSITESAQAGLEKGWDLGTKASVGASWSRTKDDSSFSTMNKRHSTSINLAVTQPLLKGLIGTPGRKALEAAELRSKAAWARYARKAEEAAARTAAAYWTVWKSSRAVQIAFEALGDSEDFLDSTRRLESLGLRDEDDFLKAQAAYLTRRAEAVASGALFEDAADGLVQLMDGKVEFGSSAPPLDPPGLSGSHDVSLEETYRGALSRRGDLKAAVWTVDGLSRERAGLSGARLPELDLKAALGFGGLDRYADRSFSNTATGDFPTWSAGFSLRYPFGGREADAEIKAASARLAAARTRREDLNAETALDLRGALRGLKSSSERLDLLEAAVSAENRAYRISLSKYGQGRVSSLDILTSQDRLRRARLGALAAEEQVALSLIDLKLSEGTFLGFVGVTLD